MTNQYQVFLQSVTLFANLHTAHLFSCCAENALKAIISVILCMTHVICDILMAVDLRRFTISKMLTFRAKILQWVYF